MKCLRRMWSRCGRMECSPRVNDRERGKEQRQKPVTGAYPPSSEMAGGVEDGLETQAHPPEYGDVAADRARQRRPGRELAGVHDAQQTERHNRQRDVTTVDPEHL